MYLKQLFVAVPAGLFILGGGVADAGETIHESSGALGLERMEASSKGRRGSPLTVH